MSADRLTAFLDLRGAVSAAPIGDGGPDTCAALTEAYLALRGATHELALQQDSSKVPAERFAKHADRVCAIWRDLFGSEPGDRSILTGDDT